MKYSVLVGVFAFASIAAASPQEFNRTLNRQLKHEYGASVAASYYKQFQLSQPAYREFTAKVEDNLTHLETIDPAQIQADLGNPVFLIASYLGHPKGRAGRLDPIAQDFRQMGYEVQLLDTDGLGSIDQNAARIQSQLNQVLSQGRNVILVAASKGTPDALTAMARFNGALEESSRPEGYGKVVAFVNICGTIEGSMLADWFFHRFKGIYRWFAKPLMPLMRAIFHQVPKSLDAFDDLTTARLQKRYAWVVPNLPHDTLYFNLTGIIPGDGLAKDPELRKVQLDYVRKYIPGAGANDGYVEYPGTAIPESWGLTTVGLVTDSSHMISDGSFEGMPLSDPAQRQRLFLAILQGLADHVIGH